MKSQALHFCSHVLSSAGLSESAVEHSRRNERLGQSFDNQQSRRRSGRCTLQAHEKTRGVSVEALATKEHTASLESLSIEGNSDEFRYDCPTTASSPSSA